MAHKVEIFYDVVSPYSYLAFETLLHYQKLWNLNLVFRPFFLGGVMQATGNQPPAVLPARGAYMMKDLIRNAKYFQRPLKKPTVFPANTLTAQRILSVLVQEKKTEKLVELSRRLWQFYWEKDKDISQIPVLVEAMESCGFSKEEATRLAEERAKDEGIKKFLKDTTDEAVSRGAFGAPSIFVTAHGSNKAELYFGSDRFHHIAQQLGVEWEGAIPKSKAKL